MRKILGKKKPQKTLMPKSKEMNLGLWDILPGLDTIQFPLSCR